MLEWLLSLFLALFSGGPTYANSSPQKDYIAVAAAEAAYSALLPDTAPVKPKVPTKDCTTCKGTGRVPTGDSNNPWTRCPDCEGKPDGQGLLDTRPRTTIQR